MNEREELVEQVRAEIVHRLSPVIGWLRRDATKGIIDTDGLRVDQFEERAKLAANEIVDLLLTGRDSDGNDSD